MHGTKSFKNEIFGLNWDSWNNFIIDYRATTYITYKSDAYIFKPSSQQKLISRFRVYYNITNLDTLVAYHIGNKIHRSYKVNEEEQWSHIILKIGFHHNIRITTAERDFTLFSMYNFGKKNSLGCGHCYEQADKTLQQAAKVLQYDHNSY